MKIKTIIIGRYYVDFKGVDTMNSTGMEFESGGCLYERGSANGHMALVTPMKTTMPVCWIGHSLEEMEAWLKMRHPGATVEIHESAKPIDVRMTEKIEAFFCQNGYPPTRLELGTTEWHLMKYWEEEMKATGLLIRNTSYPVPPHPMFKGVELHRHTHPGITARQ